MIACTGCIHGRAQAISLRVRSKLQSMRHGLIGFTLTLRKIPVDVIPRSSAR
jgi:hypothetical protein